MFCYYDNFDTNLDSDFDLNFDSDFDLDSNLALIQPSAVLSYLTLSFFIPPYSDLYSNPS